MIMFKIFNDLKVNRFYIIKMNNPIMNNNGGNMMDMMKSNLMTMLMFKSVNNGEKSNNMYDMIW